MMSLTTHEAWTCQDGEAKAKMVQDLHAQGKATIEKKVKKYQKDGN